MHLQLQSQALLIGKRPSGFTEHYFTEWDDGLGKESISLFMVLSIASSQVPGDEIGREAFQLLQDHFLNDLAGDPYDRFESALREINLMVSKKEKELEIKFVPNFHVLIGVIQKDQLFLSQRGEAQGYLVRKRHVSLITDDLYDPKNTADLFQNVASGQMEVGDTVLLVTGALVQYVTPTDLSKIFSEQPVQVASKELKDLLHQDMEDQMALLSLEVLERTELHRGMEDDEEFIRNGDEEVTYGSAESLKEQNKHVQKVKESLNVFRGWLTHEDRLAFMGRMKTLNGGVKGLRSVNPKVLLAAIGVVLVLLVLGVLLLRMDLGNKKALEDADLRLSSAEESLTRAITRGSFDKAEAADLMDEAETVALELLEKGLLSARASELLDKIDEEREALDGVVYVEEELKLLADFSALLPTAKGAITGVLPLDEMHIVYTENEVYEVLIDSISSPVLIDADQGVLAGAYFADRDSAVFLLEGADLVEYQGRNVQFADTSDVEWKSGSAIATYSSRIYVLEPEEGQIWRYQRGSAGYAGAQAYIDAATVDLKGALSMAIDGSVWVLGAEGELKKLYSGEQVEFDVLEAPLTGYKGATKVWTSLESSSLYLLDPTANKLFKFDKSTRGDDLTYSAQYVMDDLKGDLVDFYVDVERSAVILVTTQALYELSFTE